MVSCSVHLSRLISVLLLCICQAQSQTAAPADGIPNAALTTLVEDLRAGQFFTAAAVVGLLARPYLEPRVTLLIPSDAALSAAAAAAATPPTDYASLIKFHILQNDFSFRQLKLLPVGTWIPTALPNFGLQVTSNTAANFSLDEAQLINPNLCPRLVSFFISCQGVSAVLNPNSRLSLKPIPPFVFGAAPSPSALSPQRPPIFLPPSIAPRASVAPTSSILSPSPASTPLLASPASASPMSSPPSASPMSSPPTSLPLRPSSSVAPASPAFIPQPTASSPPISIGAPGAASTPQAPSNSRNLQPELSENAAASFSVAATALLTSIAAYIVVSACSL